MANITFRGKEVQTPFMRAVCTLVVVFGVFILLPVGVIVSLPIHFLLRLFWRKGFVTYDENGKITYDASAAGFKNGKQT